MVPFFVLIFMRYSILIASLFVVFLASCSSTRQWTELSQQANQAYGQAEYETALELFEQYILHFGNDATVIPHNIYRGAGLAAFQLGHTTKALDYLNTIRHTQEADAPVQYALAKANREIDNLSREITALETYVEKYPEGEEINFIRERYFETLVESSNYEQAIGLWPAIEHSARNKESLLNDNFLAHKALDNEQHLDELAQSLLTLNPNNTDALYHLARKYFWMAEERYQSELEAYERNRTHRQYAQLLKAFEVLNKDFRKSLEYFLRLYNIDPRSEYARYIGNIYLRFDDKGKAGYYHGKI